MAAGKPILSYPDETAETQRLAADAGSALFVCKDRNQIVEALNVVTAGNFPPPNPDELAGYTWGARAKVLEAVLAQSAGQGT